uniref:N-acetylglucosaminylphosphatidylinositol deacetylase n=1 Tax=Graphocephala atropunctata TaxID=36148 RepID=A0A1B6LX52_9HEMI
MDIISQNRTWINLASRSYVPTYGHGYLESKYYEETFEYIWLAFLTIWSVIVIYYVVGGVMYAFLSTVPVQVCEPQRALFVIAHPDDECMFFGPTILQLLKNHTVYLLCLSTGDYFNQGLERKSELWRSCQVLGISPSNITLMDIMDMRDDPSEWWSYRKTTQIILDQVERLSINKVFSFDPAGVSGHRNHSSIFYALGNMCVNNHMPPYCKAYMLESVNVVRKYSAFFDAAISSFNNHKFVVSWWDTRKIQEAMREHHTQLKWFRKIYIFVSRYMYINTYKELDKDDVQLCLQMYDGPIL